jgi:quercetin dioxygenase-like cupin family protein
MKSFLRLCVVALVLIWPASMVAQDPLKVDPAHYKVVLENASVRVLRVSYPVGAKSVMHQHPDALIVALSTAKVRFTLPDGKTQDSDFANEGATYTPAGTHTPANIGSTAVDGILIEFKDAAAGKAVLPTSRPNMTVKVLAEGPRASAFRATASAAFAEPAGTKHDFDQVVIALSAAPLSLSIDGKPAKTTWARGEAVFIGRGVGHEAKNTGGKPGDMIVVAIK